MKYSCLLLYKLWIRRVTECKWDQFDIVKLYIGKSCHTKQSQTITTYDEQFLTTLHLCEFDGSRWSKNLLRAHFSIFHINIIFERNFSFPFKSLLCSEYAIKWKINIATASISRFLKNLWNVWNYDDCIMFKVTKSL